ncbi:C2 domain-containing protein At1g53590-like [Macadamia integrifolia]|uniref:C2 domain-containing protein At1g53590-like n=1 Tax=Macadamia integrifolia TaxID=60698 RepID=UPI001C533F26|nr:C2 domain-containing protein At1g53590-like [Macadamia integrifolia]XP_042478482.1 C2 domain-containing protein At1g53590-like [Macadamia integrifolia]
MDITEVSIIHHVAIVFLVLWILSSLRWCYPIFYFISLIYLYQVHERYSLRLRRRIQFEERKQANQRRVLSDSETVRWLNHAVEKIWPICMEQIASQKLLLPLIPWFLEKYKPWTAKKAMVQHLYLGRTPPMFTDIRVLRQNSNDDHLVLELGMNFLSGDDMSGILAVKLRKRLGFGMWAKLHVTGMHVEGKVLVGVKFLREWPFLGRLRVCFVEPPYFQMTVKPIFNHGLDVTELPGIAGWLDKLLAIAFEQTLVEPNMLVVDIEKFASAPTERWFTVDEKDPIAYARVEIVEAADMKPSDPNGLADPYVKGQLGPYRFQTKIQKKTLTPIWQEEFKISICSWESPNILNLEVRDKDHFIDDTLGDCSVNISDLRDGQRHDMWLPLKNIKMGRLHLAVTVVDIDGKGEDRMGLEEPLNTEENESFVAAETTQKGSESNGSSEQTPKFADKFDPINIEGQQRTGVWVHHPGSDVSQTWEPRKGKSRHFETQIQREDNYSVGGANSAAAVVSNKDESGSSDGNLAGSRPKPLIAVQRGLLKLGSVFHRSPRKEELINTDEVVRSPCANLRAVNEKTTGVKLIVDDNVTVPATVKDSRADKGSLSPDESPPESPGKGNMKGMAKSVFKQAGKSAHGLKHALSRKLSKKKKGDPESVSAETDTQGPKWESSPLLMERDTIRKSDSSDEVSTTSTRDYGQTPRLDGTPIDSTFVLEHGRESLDLKDQNAQAGHCDSPTSSVPIVRVFLNDLERTNLDERKCFDMHDGRQVEESLNLKPSEAN